MLQVTVKENGKTITSSQEVGLGRFTVFAGKNNSGKTQLVNGIAEELKNQGKNVIEIPAERVILENETSTSRASDPFRDSLSNLIDLSFNGDALNFKNSIEDIENELPKIFGEYGVEDVELEAKRGSPGDNDYIKACRDVYIKKALESITIKDTLSGADGIGLKDAGQGTERLAIVSLLRYIASKRVGDFGGEVYLIVEEPEIYLHPKLKDTFNRALRDLSEKGVNVIITTHDPFFVQLGCEKEGGVVIYRVHREESQDKKGDTLWSTSCEKVNDSTFFGYQSYAEINWKVFQLPTPEYLLQLYQKLLEDKKEPIADNIKSVRDRIAHPTDKQAREGDRSFPTIEEIENVIKDLESILGNSGKGNSQA